MGYDTYINYLASMEAHIGVLKRDSHTGPVRDMDYGRPQSPGNTRLRAWISVFTNGENFPDIGTIDAVIDEAFAKIGQPQERTRYERETTNGSFDFLWRLGFPQDPPSVKRAIHEVVTRLDKPGTVRGVYCGTPSRLFRYGKRSHLTEALKRGRFRINPATFYNDLTGDAARQDDEMCRTFLRDPSTLTITTGAVTVLRPLGPVKFVSKLAADYYVLCLSMQFSAAVANEFQGCEACLIIKEPTQFAERLHAQIERVLPNYSGFDAPVSYGVKSPLGVCFTKTTGYAVQSEFRLAWTATNDTAASPKLDPFFVEVGSIEDIAELSDLPK